MRDRPWSTLARRRHGELNRMRRTRGGGFTICGRPQHCIIQANFKSVRILHHIELLRVNYVPPCYRQHYLGVIILILNFDVSLDLRFVWSFVYQFVDNLFHMISTGKMNNFDNLMNLSAQRFADTVHESFAVDARIRYYINLADRS